MNTRERRFLFAPPRGADLSFAAFPGFRRCGDSSGSFRDETRSASGKIPQADAMKLRESWIRAEHDARLPEPFAFI